MSELHHPPLRCALIGADTLLIECGQQLLDRGHEIATVVAGSTRVAEWATQLGVPVRLASAVEGWDDDLRALSVDHLLAITHLDLLPQNVIGAVRGMAINFHDGPLPEYAGLNTPVWGILRNESEWGISWHCIEAGVDSGDLVLQRRFAIAAGETALSLNTRTFEAAIESFAEVLDLLESGHVIAQAQDANARRAVFRRADRPDGVLDFNSPAEDIDRVVRALHFGPHPNPVAAAVLWHPVTAAVVGTCEIVDALQVGDPPGTLLGIDDALTVVCSTGAVQLSDLRWLDGSQCSAREFADAVGIEIGGALPSMSDGQREWLAAFARDSQPREATIAAALSALTPAEFPFSTVGSQSATRTAPGERATVTVPLDQECPPERIVAALALLLARLSLDGGAHVVLAQPPVAGFAHSVVCGEVPLDLTIDLTAPSRSITSAISRLLASDGNGAWLRDLLARMPRLAGRREFSGGLALPIGLRLSHEASLLPRAMVVLQPSPAVGWEIEFDSAAVEPGDAELFAQCLAVTTIAFAEGETNPAQTALLSAADYARVVYQWNDTEEPYELVCVHELIARQAEQTPQQQAVVCGDEVLTYEALMARSKCLAAHLQEVGVGPDSLVGVHVRRGIDLVVAVVAVLQAGGAYVPLDPAYPSDRLRHMIADSGARVIVCQQDDHDRLPLPSDGMDRVIVAVDGHHDAGPLTDTVQPQSLAYCIYTSGSAGEPKGVLIEHRNVANLFAAMDSIILPSEGSTWCAVTSLSFDISVLELLYTLARGMRIALYTSDGQQSVTRSRAMDFSLYYFSADESDEEDAAVGGKYRLLLDGARFADANGFCAVWTPERHFHAFGGLYPNPAVAAAAIATITERVSVRAGSVVLPLHHPVEIAEAWSMIDNLSNGRAGLGVASGWEPNDFVLRPENYSRAKEVLYENIEQIRQLWRGETLMMEGPDNICVAVATLPRPIQAEVPIWITTAGHHDSFIAAGAIGANLLTHLVGQSIDQLSAKIAAYRAALAAAGHNPTTGVVTLMLHTFVGDDEGFVRATVHEPLRNYLKTSVDLLREHAWSFPTYSKHDAKLGSPADLVDDNIANLNSQDLDAMLDFGAERYYETSGLFGTPEQALAVVERLQEIGVDEVACLIDFGVATETVLANLPHLARVRELAATRTVSGTSIADLLAATGATHMQCTPSMARMFTLDLDTRAALGGIRHLLVGGEALPVDLAGELQSIVDGTVTNMYGPTETTVWSSAWRFSPGIDWVPIGTPIANTQFYVLDNVGQPTPPGVAGRLWIGGDGVARGYHQRPDLTAERFRPDPFREDGRMYDTGDLARWHAEPTGGAKLEFLGRSDQQVKLRGHRIELAEVETELRRVQRVLEAAAVIRNRADDPFDQQLMAYVVTNNAAGFDSTAVRRVLRTRLPEIMVPSEIVAVSTLPRTPNGKVDRRALAARTPERAQRPRAVPARNDFERLVLSSWREVLGVDTLGIDDTFFDAGGHSLLLMRLHRRLQETLGRSIALTDLYRFPTVRTFAASLAGGDAKSAAVEDALERAARRRAKPRGRS